MKLNKKSEKLYTHEGAKTQHISPELQLRRSVMCCMLWENTFYESGESIADRIKNIIPLVKPHIVADVAIEAREKMKLRHVPLLIVREMARIPSHKHLVADTLYRVIQRPDELSEYLSIYWKEDKCPISAQSKRGLAGAFTKFNEYSLAKYARNDAIKLRDVLFLCHAKPKDNDQEELWKRLINDELKIPDTWEVSLSANDGISKKEKWERLLTENKLGGLALLRNLRNFQQENVSKDLIIKTLQNMKVERVLPFRFIAAAEYAPNFEEYLETAMLNCLRFEEKLKGETVLLIDVSGSMEDKVSKKSDITRLDAACGVAILLREICKDVSIYTFSNQLINVPPRHGFALRDVINNSQYHRGTPLGQAIRCIYGLDSDKKTKRGFWGDSNDLTYKKLDLTPDRLIVITDEQSCDNVPSPKTGKGYMINVGTNKNGVGYGSWLHIDGWSEAVINYLQEMERNELY